MVLQIVLPSEIETTLRERARASGQDPAGFVEYWVEAELAADEGASSVPRPSSKDRIDQLNAWAAMNPVLPYEADDSREAIYEGKSE